MSTLHLPRPDQREAFAAPGFHGLRASPSPGQTASRSKSRTAMPLDDQHHQTSTVKLFLSAPLAHLDAGRRGRVGDEGCRGPFHPGGDLPVRRQKTKTRGAKPTREYARTVCGYVLPTNATMNIPKTPIYLKNSEAGVAPRAMNGRPRTCSIRSGTMADYKWLRASTGERIPLRFRPLITTAALGTRAERFLVPRYRR